MHAGLAVAVEPEGRGRPALLLLQHQVVGAVSLEVVQPVVILTLFNRKGTGTNCQAYHIGYTPKCPGAGKIE